MTIKELKAEIKDLPDDMLVGRAGHFGEYVDVLTSGVVNANVFPKNRRFGEGKKVEIFEIFPYDVGDPPN